MNPRILPLLLLLAACNSGPRLQPVMDSAELRRAGFTAAEVLGDTSRYAGDPAAAARAAALLELVALGLLADPIFAPSVTVNWQQLVAMGQEEMRAYLGIAPEADAAGVAVALEAAAAALAAGNRTAAYSALSGPIFTAGGAGTLERLGAMPFLPRVAEGGGAAVVAFRVLDLRQ
jgi:hypothetical protein